MSHSVQKDLPSTEQQERHRLPECTCLVHPSNCSVSAKIEEFVIGNSQLKSSAPEHLLVKRTNAAEEAFERATVSFAAG